MIEGAAAGALLSLPPCRMRIVFLASSAEAPAVVGLFEVQDVELPVVTPPVGKLSTGQVSIVFQTTDFDGLAERLQAADMQFLTPPYRYTKSQPSERSPGGTYCQMMIYDPDHVLVGVS